MHTTPLTTPRAGERRPRLLAALAAAAALAGVLALAAPADATGTTINVNPVSGNDADPGGPTTPLKTLTKALQLAQSGDTVMLAAGGYGPGGQSGEQIPADGLKVPAGVTIDGATETGFPISTLVGPGGGAGLNLTGTATVRDLAFGGQGFGVSLYAKQGTQTLSNVLLGTASGRQAVIDGLQLSAGIVLRGTAQATLSAGAQEANTSGSTLFVNGATGVAVGEQARFTMSRAQIQLAGSANNGVSISEQGRFTMDGGKITGPAPTCALDATGVRVRDAGQATLKNTARLENVLGFGVSLTGTAKALLSRTVITRGEGAGCGRPSIDARGSSALTADGARLISTGGEDVVGLSSSDAATLALKNTLIKGHSGIGIDLNGNETLTIEGGSIASNAIGLQARVPNDNTGATKTPHVKITGASVVGNGIGLQVDEPILKLRDSKVTSNQTGIEVIGVVGGLPVEDSCFFACVNLGFTGDPGNNQFAGNTETAVRFRPKSSGPTTGLSQVFAFGNVWNANTQGANADGIYASPLTVRVAGSVGDPLAEGRNFVLPLGSNTLIRLAPAEIGTFKLTPATLTARPGRPTAWKLAWTHPASWKRLDRVVLRLEDRGKPVGRVTLDQETRRLRAFGPTVRLVKGRSAVARRQTGGKKVTARLVLRIAERYAGRTLVAEVAASDDNGNRQPFRTAGRIRVLAR